jgi:hypothetical protein
MLSSQAIDRRAKMDAAASATGELAAGAAAVATSSRLPCTVVAIDYACDTCTLEFESQGVTRVQSFTSLGAKAGGARLHRVVPSLQPGPRNKRADEKAEKARPKVEELFKAEGATSPSMRDQVSCLPQCAKTITPTLHCTPPLCTLQPCASSLQPHSPRCVGGWAVDSTRLRRRSSSTLSALPSSHCTVQGTQPTRSR